MMTDGADRLRYMVRPLFRSNGRGKILLGEDVVTPRALLTFFVMRLCHYSPSHNVQPVQLGFNKNSWRSLQNFILLIPSA